MRRFTALAVAGLCVAALGTSQAGAQGFGRPGGSGGFGGSGGLGGLIQQFSNAMGGNQGGRPPGYGGPSGGGGLQFNPFVNPGSAGGFSPIPGGMGGLGMNQQFAPQFTPQISQNPSTFQQPSTGQSFGSLPSTTQQFQQSASPTPPANTADMERTLYINATPPAAGASGQDLRYVNVKNQTGRKLRVFYEYHTRTNDGQWQWFPSDGQPLSTSLQPGAYVYLQDNNWRVNADRVKIWAELDDGRVLEHFRHEPLVVVPEVNASGQQVYNAAQIGNYTVTFR